MDFRGRLERLFCRVDVDGNLSVTNRECVLAHISEWAFFNVNLGGIAGFVISDLVP